MHRHSRELHNRIRNLRSEGKTYGEVNRLLQTKLAKSTLSCICKGVKLPLGYAERIARLNFSSINKARTIAWEMTRIKREEFFAETRRINSLIVPQMQDQRVAKIALAMLCLGEASKYSSHARRFSLGNSDPRIIVLFLELLKQCFRFDMTKIRATVQCRADQDTEKLKKYWQKITKIPINLFYKPLIDPRTVGKPTKKPNYMGVLRIDYFDTKVHLDLESLADLIYNFVSEAKVMGRWRNG